LLRGVLGISATFAGWLPACVWSARGCRTFGRLEVFWSLSVGSVASPVCHHQWQCRSAFARGLCRVAAIGDSQRSAVCAHFSGWHCFAGARNRRLGQAAHLRPSGWRHQHVLDALAVCQARRSATHHQRGLHAHWVCAFPCQDNGVTVAFSWRFFASRHGDGPFASGACIAAPCNTQSRRLIVSVPPAAPAGSCWRQALARPLAPTTGSRHPRYR
jgi:hypothetical protein